MRIIFTVLFFSILFLAKLHTQKALPVAEVVENYVDQVGFSGIILVAHQGVPIFQRSFGLAYRSTPDTIGDDYRFSIASITKLFTSIRILQLQETGALNLKASVVDYLPAFQGRISAEVTLHHLLLHISGLPNERDGIYYKELSPQEFVERCLRRKSRVDIGQFNYNNLDYVLLGLIIEQVSGNSWEQEIRSFILEPLGMDQTGFLEYGYYPSKFAYSYSQRGTRLVQDPLIHIENFYAAGNMYATVADLLKLDQGLYTEEILNESSKQLLAVSYPAYGYAGYGVWNYNYPFIKRQPVVMERRGGIMGANSALVRLTEDNYSIIILSNDDRFNPDSFGDASNLREALIRHLYREIHQKR
jgi:D-alanyl-D-alanine carboxypeptidase